MKNSIVLILVFLSLMACSSYAPSQPAGDYQTVAPDATSDTKTARLLDARALEAIKGNDLDKAEALLKQAMKADIMFGPAHNNLGHVYFMQHRFYLAAWEFQYAIKLMPFRPEPQNNLGLVFEAVGELDKAMDAYEEALQKQPDNPELIGNLARSRIRAGLKDYQTRKLLDQLVMRETRPEWRHWAEHERALLEPVSPDSKIKSNGEE